MQTELVEQMALKPAARNPPLHIDATQGIPEEPAQNGLDSSTRTVDASAHPELAGVGSRI